MLSPWPLTTTVQIVVSRMLYFTQYKLNLYLLTPCWCPHYDLFSHYKWLGNWFHVSLGHVNSPLMTMKSLMYVFLKWASVFLNFQFTDGFKVASIPRQIQTDFKSSWATLFRGTLKTAATTHKCGDTLYIPHPPKKNCCRFLAMQKTDVILTLFQCSKSSHCAFVCMIFETHQRPL